MTNDELYDDLATGSILERESGRGGEKKGLRPFSATQCGAPAPSPVPDTLALAEPSGTEN